MVYKFSRTSSISFSLERRRSSMRKRQLMPICEKVSMTVLQRFYFYFWLLMALP